MKKAHRIAGILGLLIFFSFLFSCRRILDHIHSVLGTELNSCQITRIQYELFGAHDVAITYTPEGNPLLIKPIDESDLDALTMSFHYDADHKLNYTSESDFFSNGATYYFYDAAGRIDSTHSSFGEDEEVYRKYEYDGFNRIIRITSDLYFLEFFQNRHVDNYSYDASGNLTGLGTYDHKFNLLRTNKLWMFLAHNYSVNNPLPVIGYNSFGFPLQFNGASSDFHFIDLNRDTYLPLATSTIHYTCH